MLVRKEEDVLGQAKTIVDAAKELEESEQAHLARAPSAFPALKLAAIPRLHEAVGAAVDPDVLECRQLGVNAVEREIIAGQLIAGVPDFPFLCQVLADELDLAEVMAVGDVACIEEGVRKGDLRVIRAEVEALHCAIDVRVEVKRAHERLGAAPWHAEYDEIERFDHQ